MKRLDVLSERRRGGVATLLEAFAGGLTGREELLEQGSAVIAHNTEPVPQRPVR